MPDRLFKSPVMWSAVSLALFYWFLASIIPVAALVEILNGLFVGMSLALLASNFRFWWRTMRLSKFEYHREDHYALGVELCWLMIFLNRSYAIYLRVLGTVNPIIDTHWVGVFIYGWIIAGCLQITAPGFYEGFAVGREKWTLYTFLLVGGLVSVILILAQGWGTGAIEIPLEIQIVKP